jgi:hypothetical protein
MKTVYLITLALAAATGTVGCAASGDGDATDETTAAIGSAARDGAVQHCRIVLEKIRPGESESRVYSNDCYGSQQEMLAAREIEPHASTLLMTWYIDADYRGTSTYIEGHDGPCDRDGYGIRNVNGWTWGWNDVISSFKAWNHCNFVVGYTDINYGGHSRTWFNGNGTYAVDALDVGNVGPDMNDKISSFRLQQQ